MKLVSLRILLILSLLVVVGTGSSIRAEAAAETPPANLTVEQWAGHSFVFLALPADKQAAGYEIYTEDQATRGFQGDSSVRIAYAEHVGKQVTVTQVVPFTTGDNQYDYMVHMLVNDTGEKLVGRTVRGQLEGFVLAADLKNARQQFLGKTIYPKLRNLSGLYIPGSDPNPTKVETQIGGPATVIDVYSGIQTWEPIWLVVSANGQKAILPIAYSWTNMPGNAWTQSPPWQEALFMQDPRLSSGWSQEVWNQIGSGNIQEGMTKEQIKLSWGKPVRTESDDAVWIYGTNKLSFSGEVLQAIETLPTVE
jgi:hypothetical protein